MRILISGAGVAGLTLAYWLEQAGHSATIVEKSSSIRTEGYMIDFTGTGWDVADRMGLIPEIRQNAYPTESVIYKDKTDKIEDYFQLEAKFETCDSMGANFINSCLEQFSKTLTDNISQDSRFSEKEKGIQIIMCILSNYTPECLVRSEVSCRIEELEDGNDISPEEFAQKFQRAVRIAEVEPYRATTHNKGIMNGIDAVVIATGNDFRAVEAACHTYAGRKGQYQSLTHCEVKNGFFKFWIEVPMALGTVGGLTTLHPLVKFSLEMLNQPSASQLMSIIASSGLAQNFAALRALVTTGIQKGHMKMHLLNILNQLEATEEEKKIVVEHFKTHTVSHSAAVQKFCDLRGIKSPNEISKKA